MKDDEEDTERRHSQDDAHFEERRQRVVIREHVVNYHDLPNRKKRIVSIDDNVR